MTFNSIILEFTNTIGSELIIALFASVVLFFVIVTIVDNFI